MNGKWFDLSGIVGDEKFAHFGGSERVRPDGPIRTEEKPSSESELRLAPI